MAGGSARYVEALTRPFAQRIRLNSPVHTITRTPEHVELSIRGRDGGQTSERYEQVVIATHCDEALALVSDPSPRERELLGAIPYQRNEAVLHTDATPPPRRRVVRAAWNFHLLREPKPLPTITYYMNHLQRLRNAREEEEEHFAVTLTGSQAIDPAKVIRRIDYAHPVYTARGVAAQSQHSVISGLERRTHYAGAYWGWGLHATAS